MTSERWDLFRIYEPSKKPYWMLACTDEHNFSRTFFCSTRGESKKSLLERMHLDEGMEPHDGKWRLHQMHEYLSFMDNTLY